MNRLTRLAFALTVVLTVLASALDVPAPTGASPLPSTPTRSIDISTTQGHCHVSLSSPANSDGATLTASAVVGDLTIASVFRRTTVLDALPPVTDHIETSWRQGCISSKTTAA
jgi:hypothetical protein